MSQERLDYLDMAKGIGIFFVVLGHIEYIQEGTLRWIFSFHMPLFFVIGGVLTAARDAKARSFSETLIRRAKGILVPYVSFSIILLVMAVMDFLIYPGRISKTELGRQFADTFTGYGIHILWFLPVYFLTETVFFILVKYLQEWQRNLAVILLALVSWTVSSQFGLSNYTAMEFSWAGILTMNLLIVLLRSMLALPFSLMGWYFAKLDRSCPGRWKAALLLLLVPGGFLAVRMPIFDLHYLHVQGIHYLTAACTCTGILVFCRMLPKLRPLAYLGRNSLVIMCTHASLFVVYYISLGMFFLKKFIPMTQPAFNVGVAVLVCAAEIPIIWFFNRWLKHLLGRTL